MKFSFLMRVTLVFLLFGGIVLSACSAPSNAASTPDIRQTAAAEATAIVQAGEATAMVMQAQTQAAGLKNPPTAGPTVIQLTATPEPSATMSSNPQNTPGAVDSTPVTISPTAVIPKEVTEVKIVRVGYAAEGTLIIVQFIAPPEMTRSWTQGNVSVADEKTGITYSDIPVLPIMGPMLARPKYAGQQGYVMFTNTPPGLPLDALVTVVLGTFKQEHVPVQK